MIADKLTAQQRIRLECLAQAVASSGAMAGRVQTSADVIKRADAYEAFVRRGVVPK